MSETPQARLAKLTGWLKQDPDNLALLTDAAEAALAAGDLANAERHIAHMSAIAPASTGSLYLRSVLAMNKGDFGEGAQLLEQILGSEDAPNIRFSLAWCEAMIGNKLSALGRLSEETISTIPAAAMLHTQLLHEAGDVEAALRAGKNALTLFPDDAGLASAMATLALDAEDLDLARDCAAKGGDHPEALAAAGVIELHDGDPALARQRFDRSLAIRDHNPRAWVGRGLTALAERDPSTAARDLDRGAQQFGDHIGSWIAAGWAHYLAGDIDAAADRFNRAYTIDPNFAESHGSLAVIDIARGDAQGARRKMTTALRLDRNCFSAALAQLLLNSDQPGRSREIVERAFAIPINDRGLTIASFMAGLARPTIH